ncbi:MAG: FtsX-like permease family protein [Acidobacteria bacterium]|nr:FtsX-like permease family protein [Acidobacteriota bacterium]
MMSTHQRMKSSAEVVRAAKALVIAVAAETAVTIGHFAYGAHIYNDPGRLHVVEPALVFFVVAAAVTALFVWRPGKLVLAVLGLVVTAPYLALFGLFHGAYSHLLKDALFLAGAPDETLEWLFMSPDYVRPDDFVFEASGILGLVAAAVVGYWLLRIFRDWRRPAGDSAGASTQGGPARLVGLALRMLFDAPFKSLGTLVGVVVSVFLMSQQSSLLVGILGRVTSFVNSSGVDIWIASVATESTDATDTVPASKVGAAASTPGVAWAAPVVQGLGRVTRPDGVREYVKVLGVEPPRYAGLPRSLAPGTSPSLLRASGRLFLNWNDRKTFASAEPGDRVEIDGKASVVAGFFQGMDPHSPYYYVYANIDDARALTDFPLDRVTYVAVGVAPGHRVRDVKANLEARIPEVLVRTRDELSAMEERYFLVRTPVGVLFGLGTIVAAVIGAAIVAVTLYSTAVDRARDYGTLKAIGARQKDILQLLLVQAWIFCAVGYVLGMAAFFITKYHLPELHLVSPPQMIVGVAAAAFASCTLASLLAIRRVLLLDPAIVFRT